MLLVLLLSRTQSSAAHRHLKLLSGLWITFCLPFLHDFLPQWRILPRWESPVTHLSNAIPLIGKSSSGTSVAGNIDWLSVLPVLWAGGAAWMFLRTLINVATLNYRQLETFDPECPRIAASAKRCQDSTQHKGVINVVMHPKYPMPMTWGFCSPEIWLPLEAEAWTDDQLDCVLLHEMAHIERRDFLTEILTRAVLAVYWFHPLAWSISRRMELAREMACDDRVLLSGKSAGDYAANLAHLGAGLKLPHALPEAAAGFFGRKPLLARALGIANPWQPRTSLTRNDVWGSATPIAIVAVMMGSLGFKAAAEFRNDRVHASVPSVARRAVPSIWSDVIQPAVESVRGLTVAFPPAEVVQFSESSWLAATPNSQVKARHAVSNERSTSSHVYRSLPPALENEERTISGVPPAALEPVGFSLPFGRVPAKATRVTLGTVAISPKLVVLPENEFKGLPVSEIDSRLQGESPSSRDKDKRNDVDAKSEKGSGKDGNHVSIASANEGDRLVNRRMRASTQTGESSVTVDFVVNKSVATDSLKPQSSSNLRDWRPAEDLVLSTSRNIADTDHDWIRFRLAPSPGAARFYRILREEGETNVPGKGLQVNRESTPLDRGTPGELRPDISSVLKKPGGK